MQLISMFLTNITTYTANDTPHPQEEVAFGIFNLNADPTRSSTKSISEFPRISNEISSITVLMPCCSKTWSSLLILLSNSKLYEKPEHPPDDTSTLSIEVSFASFTINSEMRFAAFSVIDKVFIINNLNNHNLSTTLITTYYLILFAKMSNLDKLFITFLGLF